VPSRPTLGELRVQLGLYAFAEKDDDGELGHQVIASWPCGCTARGADISSMEHINCSSHQTIEGAPPFPNDRRRKR
jgi:hypothetical protein